MTLKERVEETLIKVGTMDDFAKRAGVSQSSIRKVLEGRKTRPTTAYKIALACDVGESEALALAREGLPGQAKKAS